MKPETPKLKPTTPQPSKLPRYDARRWERYSYWDDRMHHNNYDLTNLKRSHRQRNDKNHAIRP
jgi:hypothetical protein